MRPPPDGTEERPYPLGTPVQKKPAEQPEWVAVKPGIERNTKTGAMRTNAPTPPQA